MYIIPTTDTKVNKKTVYLSIKKGCLFMTSSKLGSPAKNAKFMADPWNKFHSKWCIAVIFFLELTIKLTHSVNYIGH